MSDYNSLKNSALTTPTGNLDLGSAANRYGNIFLQGNLAIGNLVANESTLTTPKITSLTYVGDDTAVDPAGGQLITVNGSGFTPGAVVYVAGSVVGVTNILSPAAITFVSPAKTAGNYALLVVNLDGGTATFIPGIQYSGVPAWSTTAGSLANVYEYATVSTTLTATSDSSVTYSVTSGTLPTGVTLNSATGVVAGTAPALGSGATTYSFTANAKDGENQDTPRNFSITVNADAVTWSSPTNNSTISPMVGIVFTQELSASSAAGNLITYTANSLPSGLSIVGTNITGTPTTVGNVTSLITATAASTGKTASITVNLNTAESYITATGGTITYDGNYKVHTFTTSATLNVSSVSASSSRNTMNYLVVGGGGGAGSGTGEFWGGGGGGGAAAATGNITATMSLTPITITVGAGGTAATVASPTASTDGSASSIFTSLGEAARGAAGKLGTSGNGGLGGFSGNGNAYGASRQGNGEGSSGGGSGGAGFAYNDATKPGQGGIGTLYSDYTKFGTDITNSIAPLTGKGYFGGGGGAGNWRIHPGRAGGYGGGGNSQVQQPGLAGLAATGGGGGGGAGEEKDGGAGGSGVVIIKYQYQ